MVRAHRAGVTDVALAAAGSRTTVLRARRRIDARATAIDLAQGTGDGTLSCIADLAEREAVRPGTAAASSATGGRAAVLVVHRRIDAGTVADDLRRAA